MDDEVITEVYPVKPYGLLAEGLRVYVSEGCANCHSQIVRGLGSGDVSRGFGVRSTVPRDYILDKPSVLGSFRLGPDLSNYGSKEWRSDASSAGQGAFDSNRVLAKLYFGFKLVSGSSMPDYKNLFQTRRRLGQGSPNALVLTGYGAVPEGFEVIPKPEAVALVAYLESLARQHSFNTSAAVEVSGR
jgi:cytochrome c oxidase cbb3-type subunit 2